MQDSSNESQKQIKRAEKASLIVLIVLTTLGAGALYLFSDYKIPSELQGVGVTNRAAPILR